MSLLIQKLKGIFSSVTDLPCSESLWLTASLLCSSFGCELINSETKNLTEATFIFTFICERFASSRRKLNILVYSKTQFHLKLTERYLPEGQVPYSLIGKRKPGRKFKRVKWVLYFTKKQRHELIAGK